VAEVLVVSQTVQVPLQEPESCWESEVELQSAQNQELHLEHVLLCVGSVRYVDEVFDLWRVDFFVLAGKQ
jgi:hypothetical protein